jgi:8-oxo-dGTP pyrophosphatase MutT (NUDIX family)
LSTESGREQPVREQFPQSSDVLAEYGSWSNDERLITEILRPLAAVRQDALCLDIAGGGGVVAERGGAIAGRWAVLDLPLSMAKARSSTVIAADVEFLPFSNDTFDFVCERSMLRYFDQEASFREVRRVMQQDGLFVVAEKVLGDYDGPAEEWFRKVEAIRNPLKGPVQRTVVLGPALRSAGFEVQASIELRRSYVQDLSEWLSRGGSISSAGRVELEMLLTQRPSEVRDLGLDVAGGQITVPISWAVLCAKVSSPRPAPALVVSLIPIRMRDRHLEIYVQERRAPVMSEPEFVGRLEFPQGHVEAGESIEQTARRELAEESGLSIRRVLGARRFASTWRASHDLTVESATPFQVVVTRGRLNFLSLAFIVEADETSHGAPGVTDNRGRWVTSKDFAAIAPSEDKVYPLNAPMFRLVASRLKEIEAMLP